MNQGIEEVTLYDDTSTGAGAETNKFGAAGFITIHITIAVTGTVSIQSRDKLSGTWRNLSGATNVTSTTTLVLLGPQSRLRANVPAAGGSVKVSAIGVQ
jgi:hypothetical protein